MLSKSTYLVYCYIGAKAHGALPQEGIEVKVATPDTVEVLFRNDNRLKKTFLAFLRKKFYGIFLVQDNQWVTYGWLSRPQTPGPIHLPAKIKQMDVYWIFYCRTREGYQGRGLYKHLLRLLIGQALSESKNADVYVDTVADNVPSHQAVTSVGFRFCGIIETSKLGMPKLGSWILGRWDKEVEHQNLPKGTLV
ncbi:MAG: GNAT family N-acetyltransferase [Actinobacteria bacterium]|nr:GNAT family N-acetyltransferase [Actinomycetota bacterium]